MRSRWKTKWRLWKCPNGPIPHLVRTRPLHYHAGLETKEITRMKIHGGNRILVTTLQIVLTSPGQDKVRPRQVSFSSHLHASIVKETDIWFSIARKSWKWHTYYNNDFVATWKLLPDVRGDMPTKCPDAKTQSSLTSEAIQSLVNNIWSVVRKIIDQLCYRISCTHNYWSVVCVIKSVVNIIRSVVHTIIDQLYIFYDQF